VHLQIFEHLSHIAPAPGVAFHQRAPNAMQLDDIEVPISFFPCNIVFLMIELQSCGRQDKPGWGWLFVVFQGRQLGGRVQYSAVGGQV
jgi:hypothetical protein